ncbi:MAG: Bax inhibitor-1/YccA family protein [Brevibacterium aurantiacum]|nr:Bax inhibitor-1/YccA family protein [Brevibacterium aurantiacum]MDN5716771.1 Bax inhibitor-1/YccA family protein [Janibacter sp.]MDN5738400.1 Bax inhibitor-1/YccA family protein [Brevibacterium aurantiacum]
MRGPSATRVLWAALALLVVLHLGALAGIGWAAMPAVTAGEPREVTFAPWILGGAGVVAAVWLMRRAPHRLVWILAVAAFEGVFLGGLATYFEGLFPGVVMQVAFAILSPAAAALAMMAIPRIRNGGRAVRMVAIAGASYLLFALHNVALSGMPFLPEGTSWGQAAPKVASLPLGVVITIPVVLLTSYALTVTLEQVLCPAAREPAPRRAWQSALGIMLTIIGCSAIVPRVRTTRSLTFDNG